MPWLFRFSWILLSDTPFRMSLMTTLPWGISCSPSLALGYLGSYLSSVKLIICCFLPFAPFHTADFEKSNSISGLLIWWYVEHFLLMFGLHRCQQITSSRSWVFWCCLLLDVRIFLLVLLTLYTSVKLSSRSFCLIKAKPVFISASISVMSSLSFWFFLTQAIPVLWASSWFSFPYFIGNSVKSLVYN